jgi:protein-disulfide isomerase
LLALALLGAAAAPFPARLERYVTDWYATIPGTAVTVAPTAEITVPGYTAWRLERKSEAGVAARAESGLAVADATREEVFLGEILHDPERMAAGKPFEAERDLPNVRASLTEVLGLPARIELVRPDSSRPSLVPIAVHVRQDEEASTTLPGFLSKDGASVLLGEFHRIAEPIAGWRRRLLAERPGIRGGDGDAKGKAAPFTLTEFLDFQCERCKRRTPEARKATAELGGTVETRFLPLVKQHDWAFPAAVCAAALAESGPSGPVLYRRYEEAVFGRFEGMSAAAAREIASDLAESAGVKAAYQAALSSGRARDRVVKDIELASRLGIHGTPSFVLDGRLVPGERGYLENALMGMYGPGRKKESADRVVR